MNHHTTIRLINDPLISADVLPGVWVEILRRAGYLKVLSVSLAGKTENEVLEFRCPYNLSISRTKIWAKEEAERMQSFGLNAVTAPPWEGESLD